MEKNIRAPFYVSIATLGICVIVPWIKPDPQPRQQLPRSPRLSAAQDERVANLRADVTQPMLTSPENNEENIPVDQAVTFKNLVQRITSFSKQETLVFSIVGVSIWRLGTVCELFFPQYASEKFHWELSETTWLKFASTTGALISTVFLGPLFSRYFFKQGIPAHFINLRFASASNAILLISYLSAWIAHSKAWLLICKKPFGIIF